MNDTPNALQADTPIFDALAQHAPDAVLAEVEEAEAADRNEEDPVDTDAIGTDLPPDAAARDAARREEAGTADDTLHASEFRFVTRGVSDEEQAAVIAVLTQVRTEETDRMKRVERREHQPWARSQRVPEGISDLLAEG